MAQVGIFFTLRLFDWESFINKKVGNRINYATLVDNFKSFYNKSGLSFFDFQLFINKTYQANNWNTCINLALTVSRSMFNSTTSLFVRYWVVSWTFIQGFIRVFFWISSYQLRPLRRCLLLHLIQKKPRTKVQLARKVRLY